MFSFRKKSKSRRRSSRQLRCESLERRRLLAVVWSNRGSDSNDSDGFTAQFGENADIARATVDTAIANWNNVITSFNYSDASLNNTYDITFSVADIDKSNAASTSIDNFDDAGKPTSGAVKIGSHVNWGLDATPGDNVEFTDITNPFWATDPTGSDVNGKDLLQAMQHELGHALGINIGPGSAAKTFSVNTGVKDGNDASKTLHLVTAPSGLQATLTSGHFYEGPTVQFEGNNLPTIENDLMNSGRTVSGPNIRRLISDFDVTFLRDIYGYSVRMPSMINTFHAELDQTTDELVVRGTESGDRIFIQQLQAKNRVGVNDTREAFDPDEISSTKIFAGDGNDAIRLDSKLSGLISLDGGDGVDRLQFNQAVDAIFASRDQDSLSGVLRTDNGLVVNFAGVEKFDFVRPDAGTGYSVDEGGHVTLNGTYVLPPTEELEFPLWSRVVNEPTVPAGATVEIVEWDLDGDGIFGETDADARFGDETGATVNFDAAMIDGVAAGTTIPVSFRVTDTNGNRITSQTKVVVNNVSPQSASVSVSSQLITEGESLTLVGTFTDPSALDTLTILIDWGDGETRTISLDAGERSFRAEHTYDDPGTPTLSVRALDDDGGASSIRSIDIEVNANPIANPDRVETGEDVAVNIDVLNNDTDADADTLSLVAARAENGTVRIEDDGTLSYRPNLNFTGVDSIVYRISDGRGGFAESTVTVRVLSPAQQLSNLRDDVRSLQQSGDLTKGQAGALIKKLEPKGSLKATINSLKSFVQQVGELVELGQLDSEDGLRLIGAVRDIRTGLFVR
ncbi:Ig-like domain-containing protein [Stieleria sp. JC731]|uniref:Ig-like domain-containing protein n=1 Tax=Pirellulaceae TaxID=2691357 RepID=UPI001E4AD968|nr:Ig-like domain-containing protein [Stieleria sp. JC731]MCC9600302.1 Ig-like domain-containing protein [Stieleria sp. JC731]